MMVFMWPEEFQVIDDQDQVIVSVGLVKPKPGVFLDQINYLLVIATPIEIILVAVAATQSNGLTSLKLYSTDISIPSDNISMISIVGSVDGRIFMCGNNGNIYELQYQSEDGWLYRRCRMVDLTSPPYKHFIPSLPFFSSNERGNNSYDEYRFMRLDPIRKVCIDAERQLLYSLSDSSVIELVYLGPKGQDFKKVYKFADTFQQAQKWLEAANISSTSYLDPRSFQIISIHPILVGESKQLNLVALTSSGFRLYFSCKRNSSLIIPSKSSETAEPTGLQLVFIRPPPQIKDRYRLHDASYSKGVLAAANSVSEDTDSILCISPNKFSHEEMYGFDPIEGKTWAIVVEETGRSDVESENFTGSSRRFLLLSNTGIISYMARSPIEFLKLLLEDSSVKGNWAPGLPQFITRFSMDHICFLCLAIVCSPERYNDVVFSQETLQYSLKTLFLGSVAKANVKSWAKRLFLETGSQPMKRLDQPKTALSSLYMQNEALGRPLTDVDSTLSARLDGLTLFLAKLLQPIWKKPLAIPLLAKPLNANDFDNGRIGISESSSEREALQREQISLQNMLDLVKLSIEGTSFAIFLMDVGIVRLQEILENTNGLKNFVTEQSFESLITSPMGREIGKIVFASIIQSKINEGVEINGICESTHRQCPTFCSLDDIILYRGMECLKKSSFERGSSAENLLSESLSHFLRILPSLQFDRLREICNLYVVAQDLSRPIRLVLAYAAAHDPSNLAISYFMEGMPENDFRKDLYLGRRQCYELLQQLPMMMEAENIAQGKSPEGIQSTFLEEIFLSDDKLLHFHFFNWLLESGSADKLIEVESPYLEEYLGSDPLTFEKINTLWRYYVKREQFLNSAKVLCAICTSKKYDLNFLKRFELLQLAVANALSSSFSDNDADFIRDLGDKKDVAKIQMDIVLACENLKFATPDDPLFRSLMSISELYVNYAKRFDLHEISLDILHASGHKDPTLVQSLWEKIMGDHLSSDEIRILWEKIRNLGLKYFPDENVFPLAFIASKLEQICIQRGDANEEGAVISLMRAIQIPYGVLFQVYFALFENKVV
ncbi:hypothetical protein HDU67_007637 [Dinochytrium kinnereticum]|nr:hypothetical protein HDU67_007637 [Dinochytrium kinnereticum]